MSKFLGSTLLQELNTDNSISLTEAVSCVENGETVAHDHDKPMMIQLSKLQIDKVSKDHNNRFPETFKVSLIVAHPNQLKEEASSDPAGIER